MKIFLTLILVSVLSFTAWKIYDNHIRPPRADEVFIDKVVDKINSGQSSFQLSEVTDFEWDRVMFWGSDYSQPFLAYSSYYSEDKDKDGFVELPEKVYEFIATFYENDTIVKVIPFETRRIDTKFYRDGSIDFGDKYGNKDELKVVYVMGGNTSVKSSEGNIYLQKLN